MKLVWVTQRVDVLGSYQERRDGLDQRWAGFLASAGLLPVLVPNHLATVKDMLAHHSQDVAGLVLTGGNSLMRYDGDAPERDAVETWLLGYAVSRRLPVVGVCRGMQLILDYFGTKLVRLEGYVGTLHALVAQDKKHRSSDTRTVTAYFNWGAKNVKLPMEVTATTGDGVAMAAAHKELPIYGQMWHPERETPISANDQWVWRKMWETRV
jgi:putative glutamine amidotransferase